MSTAFCHYVRDGPDDDPDEDDLDDNGTIDDDDPMLPMIDIGGESGTA